MPKRSISVKSDKPMRPGSCTWRKTTSRSSPWTARQPRMRRSSVRRTLGRQLRMAPHQLLEHRHWPHARCRLQQRHHFGVEDLGQRIRPASLAWRLLLRRQPRVLLEAIGRGDAEPGTGGRLRRPFGQSELHVEPHLVVVDVSSGHGQALENEIPAPYPIHRDYRRGPNGGPLRRARGREGSGLRPAPSRPRGPSHPD